MAKINFYTAEELETLTSEVLANKRPCDIAKEYSKKWNRPINGLSFKINILRRDLKLTKIINKKVQIVKSTKKVGRPRKEAIITTSKVTIENGVTLPSGFVFDFAPKRAEMHSDHVRLFF
jgi:hypothetical protein